AAAPCNFAQARARRAPVYAVRFPDRAQFLLRRYEMRVRRPEMTARAACAIDRPIGFAYLRALLRRQRQTTTFDRSQPREADLSAEPTRAQAPSRLPHAHGHQERPQGRSAPPRPRSQAPDGLKAYARSGSPERGLSPCRKLGNQGHTPISDIGMQAQRALA